MTKSIKSRMRKTFIHLVIQPNIATLKVVIRVAVILVVLCGNHFLPQAAWGQSTSLNASSSIDQAISLLNEARRTLQDVRDYECRMIGRERIKGDLLPETVMTMRVRHDPLSIYVRSESPASEKGLEACYIAGRNQEKMRVRPAGMLGIFGFWSVDTHDPRAFETNRHCITEAGLSNLLECTAKYWKMERRLNKTLVRISDDEVAGRPCTRIETIHPDRTRQPSMAIDVYCGWIRKRTCR